MFVHFLNVRTKRTSDLHFQPLCASRGELLFICQAIVDIQYFFFSSSSLLYWLEKIITTVERFSLFLSFPLFPSRFRYYFNISHVLIECRIIRPDEIGIY